MRCVPLFILLALLSACGQKGPLFLPESAASKQVSAPGTDPGTASDTDEELPSQKRKPGDD